MFGGFGLTELLVILAIVLLIFGPKRLKNIGADLGSAIKGFRTAVTTDEEKPEAPVDPKVIEGEVDSNTTVEAKEESASKQNSNV
jgi:sec-independent protein translocase protein TatA